LNATSFSPSPRAESRDHVARGREPIRRDAASRNTSSSHEKTNPSSEFAYATGQADFDIDSIVREVVRTGNINAEPAEAGNDETRRPPDRLHLQLSDYDDGVDSPACRFRRLSTLVISVVKPSDQVPKRWVTVWGNSYGCGKPQ
jgi:hypothetical protein